MINWQDQAILLLDGRPLGECRLKSGAKKQMATFEIMVKLPNGTARNVQIQAQNGIDARAIAQAQYGAKNVIGLPIKK